MGGVPTMDLAAVTATLEQNNKRSADNLATIRRLKAQVVQLQEQKSKAEAELRSLTGACHLRACVASVGHDVHPSPLQP